MLPLLAAAKDKQVLKVSLNVYSFNQAIRDGLPLMDVLEWAAKTKFEGIDPTGYYFPGYPKTPSDSYVDTFRKRATDLGIGISGTGVRNNFTPADASIRNADIALVKQWVDVAARLGAPVLRVFADTQDGKKWQDVADGHTREQVQVWIADAIRECAEYAGKHGVHIGIQNHADFLQTAPQLLSLLKAVGSKWCGAIVDIGSFRTSDPYTDIAQAAPHAINWQIKTQVLPDTPTDLPKLAAIIKNSGYSGYLPIETLSQRGKPYDPYTLVPQFLNDVRAALARTS